jgi:hypothetical protein
MSNYEAPAITELGTVADFTRGDTFAWAFDGFRSEHVLGEDATS